MEGVRIPESRTEQPARKAELVRVGSGLGAIVQKLLVASLLTVLFGCLTPLAQGYKSWAKTSLAELRGFFPLSSNFQGAVNRGYLDSFIPI